jgi:hypothetical protein
LIKISDSLRLLEPTLLALAASPTAPALRPAVGEDLRALDPAKLKGRNRTISEETKAIARRELESLRSLIARITAISRKGLADSAAQFAQRGLRAGGKTGRKTADGADMGGMSAADLHETLRDLLRRTAASLGELRGKVEGARKRSFKSDLQHTLQLFSEKIKNAGEACDASDLDAIEAAQAPAVSDRIVPLLREIMAAQTNAGARVGNAKLTPAEKQPLLALLHSVKSRIGDDLRDMERIRAELADRLADAQERPPAEAASAEAVIPVGPEEAPSGSGVAGEGAVEAPTTAPEVEQRVPAGREIAELVSAANQALKTVKDLMVNVSGTISSGKHDSRGIRAATHALKSGITEARDLVTWNLGQIKALSAAPATTTDEYVEKLDRWNGQLLALGRETDSLLKVTDAVAELDASVQTAAALEKGISDTVRLLSVQEVGADDLILLRGRCVTALETITTLLGRLRETLEFLTEAAKADWHLLKKATGYLMRRRSELAAVESGLKSKHARVVRVLKLLETLHTGA